MYRYASRLLAQQVLELCSEGCEWLLAVYFGWVEAWARVYAIGLPDRAAVAGAEELLDVSERAQVEARRQATGNRPMKLSITHSAKTSMQYARW